MKLGTALLLIAGGVLMLLYIPEPGVPGLLGTLIGVALTSLGLMAWESEVEGARR